MEIAGDKRDSEFRIPNSGFQSVPVAGLSGTGFGSRRWVAINEDSDASHGQYALRLAEEVGVSPVTAHLLVNRGITTAEEAHRFLHPSLDDLRDPYLLPDMDIAVGRLRKALERREKILIHGDYDVDGITSAALLIRVLRALGAHVEFFVPHRVRDGYGIKPCTAEDAHARGISLIVTADCGITACDTAQRAVELGVDLIVTDHHEPGATLPEALAIVNPLRKDSNYPFKDLAGVGVAFKLAQALVRELGHDKQKFQQRFLDLVALGTIADVAPVLGENRALVKFGLETLANSKKTGIQALLRSSGLTSDRLVPLTTHSVSYILGPRINAVGRMDDAALALKLFLTKDRQEAEDLSALMERRNTERQEEQSLILQEACSMLEEQNMIRLDGPRVLILAASHWNAGIVGVVASKIVDRFSRPTILISADEQSGIGVGSARSIEGFNLVEALTECKDLLERFGGHAMAAGLCVHLNQIGELETRLNEAAERLIPEEALIPRWELDGFLDPTEISLRLADEIALLEPFGCGNPEPLFASTGVTVLQKRRVGSSGNHLKLLVRADGVDPTDCIGFGLGDLESGLPIGYDFDLCYNLRANEYDGRRSAQILIRDIRPSNPSAGPATEVRRNV